MLMTNCKDSVLKNITIGIISLGLSAGLGCSVKMSTPNQQGNASTPVGQPPTAPVAVMEKWQENLIARGNAKIQVKTLKVEYREDMKKRFKVPNLEEVKSDFSGNYNLFQVKNFDEAKGIVFIQPKIFVYGTAQGGNVLAIKSVDGSRLTLTIPISFVDGQRQTLPSYEGRSAVPVPKSLLIPDMKALKDDLRSKLGTDVQLQALPTCARQLSLKHIKGAVVEKMILKPTQDISKRCPINEFFTASVTSSREEVTQLIENALEDGLGVQIATQFKIEYREPVVVYSLDLNPRGVFEKVRAKFIASAFGSGFEPTIYLAHEIIFPLQDILTDEIGQTGVNPAWVPYSQGVSLLQDAFFDDVSGTPGCPAPNHCYRVKKVSDVNFDGPIELMWIEQDTLGSSDLISSVSMVKGLAESFPLSLSSQRSIPMLSVIPTPDACANAKGNLPGCPEFSCSKFPDNVYCRDGKTKADVNQFQVFPGAKLKLSFSRATEWGYELDFPRNDTPEEMKKGVLKCADSRQIPGACLEYENICPVAKVDYCPKPSPNTCGEPRDIYTEHCHDEVTYESNCGFLGWGHCTQELKQKVHKCEQVKTGTECLKWNESCDVKLEPRCPVQEITQCKTPVQVCEQYTSEFYSKYTFSEPWVRPRTVDLDQGETVTELWSGLDIEFTSLNPDGKTFRKTTCPLLAFAHEMTGHHTLTVKLDNQEGTDCQPFNEWNSREGRWPSIAIVNHISYPRNYRCGTLEWTHAVDSNPKSSTHVVDRMVFSCLETGEKSDHYIIRSYQPIVDLFGTISILGRSIDTISGGISK